MDMSRRAHPGLGRRMLVRTSLAVLLGLLAGASGVQAQGYPAEMMITQREVEVRSGPTKEYYATGKLYYGDRVWVQHESKDQPGWLAITPPKGSFSWINAKFVKQTDAHTGYVEAAGGAMLRPGSSVTNKPPNVESVKIPAGSIVTILGKSESSDGESWLPIQAWQREVRFIPGEAVQSRQFAGASNPTGTSPSATNIPNNIGTAAPPAQFASRTKDTWTAVPAPGNPTQMAQGNTWPPAQAASFAPASPYVSYPPHWSQVGVLRKAAFNTNGQPTYVLEDRKGSPLLYATCPPGLTLRDFEGRPVALYGSIAYRSDDYLRTHIMVASHVAAYPR
jgi:hypothetical protein